jgi:hypothetical protein
MTKFPTSTTLFTGLRPAARRRCWIQAGAAPILTPDIACAEYKGHSVAQRLVEPRRKLARNPQVAQAVRAVRRDLDVENRVGRRQDLVDGAAHLRLGP